MNTEMREAIKQAIILGVGILDDERLRKLFIVTNNFCKSQGKGIAISGGKGIIV